MNIGLGSDVAGGHCLSILRAVADTDSNVQVSGVLWIIPKSLFLSVKLFIWHQRGAEAFLEKWEALKTVMRWMQLLLMILRSLIPSH